MAVSFLSQPPPGVARFEGRAPAGCSFWRRGETQAFYTQANDHAECPIGTQILGFEISADRLESSRKFIGDLCDLGYVSEVEFSALPRVPAGHHIVLYTPLREAHRAPDAVISTCRASQAMMFYEAGRRLGMPEGSGPAGRPTCAVIPRSMQTRGVAMSLGCTGARVYAGIAPDEMVFSLPGQRLEEILAALEVVRAVNQDLEMFHLRQRDGAGGRAVL